MDYNYLLNSIFWVFYLFLLNKWHASIVVHILGVIRGQLIYLLEYLTSAERLAKSVEAFA